MTQLRASGALILGKTNLSEWANIRSMRSTSGWSARGGRTRNPYALDRNTSGSSSGSAVAVSANLCVVAVGTETDGSIVSPSSINGIVGIKPTVGLASRRPASFPLRTRRTRPDRWRAACAMPRYCSVHSSATIRVTTWRGLPARAGLPVPRITHATWTETVCKGARIGVARNFFGFHDGVDAVMNNALALMRKAGATLVDPADLPNMDKLGDPELLVLLHELKADLDAYLQQRGAGVRSLEEVIAYNERHRVREMPYFGQDLFIKAQAKGPLSSSEYIEALATCKRIARSEGIDAVMDRERLDAIVAPTDSPAWLTDLVLGDHAIGTSSSAAAVAGYPSITVPAGFVSGLPVGISFFGRAWSEPTLLDIAYAFEQESRARRPPAFAATTGPES